MHLSSQRTPQTETNILPIVTPFSDIGKLLSAIIHRNWHNVVNDITLSTIWLSKPLSALPNPAVFITTLFTLHKHMAPYGRIPSTTTPTYPIYTNIDTSTMIYAWRYKQSRYTSFFPNTGHTQLILILWTINVTSRHAMKILISSNDHRAHQRSHPHAVDLENLVMHCL